MCTVICMWRVGLHLLPYLRQDLRFIAIYPRLASGDSPVPVSHLHTGNAEAHPAIAPFLHRFGRSNLRDKNFAH